MILSGAPPPRVAFSTLAFPDAILASAVSLGRRWGYAGVELRLIDGELIDPSMPAADRARVNRALAGLPEGFHRAAEALKFLLNEASISWR